MHFDETARELQMPLVPATIFIDPMTLRTLRTPLLNQDCGDLKALLLPLGYHNFDEYGPPK